MIRKTLHSEDTITEAEAELIVFVKHVDMFRLYSKSLFNFPKFYSMIYYSIFITSRGLLDNFIIKHYKYQYIIDAKNPFHHMNKKFLILQILL